MKCPNCSQAGTHHVIDSRDVTIGTRRRRTCTCGARWTTTEIAAVPEELATIAALVADPLRCRVLIKLAALVDEAVAEVMTPQPVQPVDPVPPAQDLYYTERCAECDAPPGQACRRDGGARDLAVVHDVRVDAVAGRKVELHPDA